MSEFEQVYTNVQGSELVNELAKIIFRYSKEGKWTPPPVLAQPVVADLAIVNQSQSYFSSAKKSVVDKSPAPVKAPIEHNASPAANGPSPSAVKLEETPLRMSQANPVNI